jgi:hypothetical protein
MERPVLRGVLVYRSKSGALEFSRGLSHSDSSFAALISTVQVLSRLTAGGQIAHFALSNSALTIVQSPENGLGVAIFHDSSFYRCVAREIATCILREYSGRLNQSAGSISFPIGALKIAIQSAARSVMRWLTTKLRGVILFAAIFSGNDIQETYPTNSDAVSVGTTLDELQMSLRDLGRMVSDQPYELVIEADQVVTRLVLYEFESEETTLLLQLRAESNSPVVIAQLTEMLDMLALCLRTSARVYSLGESESA